MAFQRKPLRIGYIIAAVMFISALAIAGVTWKYHFWGKIDGKYIFTTVPERTEIDEDGNAVVHDGSIVSVQSTNPITLDDAKRSLEHLAEIDKLRQQGKRELIKVTEVKVGSAVHKDYLYRYVLADDGEATVAEGAENIPGKSGKKVPVEVVREVYDFLQAGEKGKLIGTEEREVKGKNFSFKKYKLMLSNGHEVILSIGTLIEE